MKKQFYIFLYLFSMLLGCSEGGNHKKEALNPKATAKDTVLINKLIDRARQTEVTSPDSAFGFVMKAEDLSKKIDFNIGYANSLFVHGILFYKQNNYKQALSYFSKAFELADKLNLILLKGNCLEQIASLHLDSDDPNLALKQYYESLSLFEKVHDSGGIARVYNIIGVYKTETKDFEKGEYYLKTALRINTKLKNVRNIIHNKGNLAYLYECRGLPDTAVKIYDDLIQELIRINDRSTLLVIYYDLSGLDQKKKDIPATFRHLRLGTQLAESTGDTSMLPVLYGSTGEMLLNTGKIDSARFYLQKSVICARVANDMETEIQALSFLVRIDSMKGDFRSALTFNQKILSLKDTVNQHKLKNNLKTSELKYENQKKQNLIDIQEIKLNTDRKERWLYIILLVISLNAGAFLIRMIILGKRQERKNNQIHEQELLIHKLEVERLQKLEEIHKLNLEKVEEEIKARERELVSIALRVDQKNELLDFLTKKLRELSGKKSDQNTINFMKELEGTVKLRMNESDDADLFNERFTQLHQNFFPVLKEKHPELSKTELKFCAYLKIHLSTNQIAAIFNVTIEAIRKTRYRIRKKLNLAPEASLEDYISNF